MKANVIADLIQLVYISQPFGYDVPALSSILQTARDCNVQDNITGALMCRRDVFLQLLEGPTDQVLQTYDRIKLDDRHSGIKQLVSRPITTRIFEDWAMLHDPATSLIWTEDEIASGISERASAKDIQSMFEALAENVRKNGPPV